MSGSGQISMEQIKQNADQTKEVIQELKNEVWYRIAVLFCKIIMFTFSSVC